MVQLSPELEAALMAPKKLIPLPSPLEDEALSDVERAIIGGPLRIELPFETRFGARDAVRKLKAALDMADAILSDLTSKEHHALSNARSTIAIAKKSFDTRQGRKKDNR